MAANLNPIRRQKTKDRGPRACRGCAACFFCLLSSVFCPLSAAQALTDPTKPPAEISVPLTQAGQAAAPESDRLQSVIISPARRAAIINGQTVELGAKHGEAKLIEVSESGVVLLGVRGRQVLTLFPGVEVKRKEPPEKNNVKYTTQKNTPVTKPASQAVKKEGK